MGKTLTCCTHTWRIIFIVLNIFFTVSSGGDGYPRNDTVAKCEKERERETGKR